MNTDSPPVTTSLGFDLKDKASKLRKNAGRPPVAHPRFAKILVVDNDPALRRLLSIRLGAANYEVESVSDARAAFVAAPLDNVLTVGSAHSNTKAVGLAFFAVIGLKSPLHESSGPLKR